jgi:hypothetical protein
MRNIFLIATISFILFNCSANNKQTGDIQIMDATLKKDLQTIAKAKIFFGHQSVGYNIIEGLSELNQKAQGGIDIIELQDNVFLPQSYFAHKKNGINEKPESKCDAFAQTLDSGFADSLDIAFFKFCYIDFNKESNVQAIFDYYKKTVKSIRLKHPQLKIIHVTAPLRLIQQGIKARLKDFLGKERGGTVENIKRNQYNDLLKKEFKNEPIFDLAKVESTYPDGTRETFEKDGKKYYTMIPAFTKDSGHLNTIGSQLAAKELAHVLAQTLTKSE